MSEQEYKWSHPSEWLAEKIRQNASNPPWLIGVLQSLLPSLDGDTIQDTFQSEMDDDGYFDATESPTSPINPISPIVNGEQFAPGYTAEAAAYEQHTR